MKHGKKSDWVCWLARLADWTVVERVPGTMDALRECSILLRARNIEPFMPTYEMYERKLMELATMQAQGEEGPRRVL